MRGVLSGAEVTVASEGAGIRFGSGMGRRRAGGSLASTTSIIRRTLRKVFFAALSWRIMCRYPTGALAVPGVLSGAEVTVVSEGFPTPVRSGPGALQ